MKILIFIMSLCFYLASYAETPNAATSDTSKIVFSAKQVRKIDSLLKDADATKLKFSLSQQQLNLSLQIEDSLKSKISMLNSKIDFMNEKNKLFKENDSLTQERADTYRKLFLDVNASLDKEKNRRSNSTLWFVAGSASGIALIYISSIIVGNVSK